MSVLGTDPYSARVYGKRSGAKRKQGAQLEPERVQVGSLGHVSTKRRRMAPGTLARTPSPTNDTDDAAASGSPRYTSRMPSTEYTNGDPLKKQTARSSSPQPSPVKPTKPARDLSGLFDAITTSASPKPSPTKITKRMLVRSKTESSLEPQPTTQGNIMDRTSSLPSIPSSPSRPRTNASTSDFVSNILPILPSTTKTSTTRTYAGKFRSFLVTLPPTSAPNSQNLEDDDAFDTRESYNSLRTRWGVDNSEDDPYPYDSPPFNSNSATPEVSPARKGKGKSNSTLPSNRPTAISYGMSNPLKSISELRNKGETRRFLDELGYLFEGMDKNGGVGLRRASALEIVTKLCDTDFARKAKTADFYARTWDLFLDAGAGKGDDKVFDVLVAFFAALVARDPTSLAELAQRPSSAPSTSSKRPTNAEDEDCSFVSILFKMLDSMSADVDPLTLVASRPGASDSDLKKIGIAKKDRSMLTTIYRTITSKSKLFPSDTPVSISLLISYALQSLPPSMIPNEFFTIFLRSLQLSLAPVDGTSLSSSVMLRWRDAVEAVPYQSLYYHLRLLDAYLLDQWEPPPDESNKSSQEADSGKEINDQKMERARDSWLADDLVAFGLCTELSNEIDGPSTQQCLDITLRVLVSLTHGDKRWGRRVAEGDYTMGLLMRTIYNAARELQLNKSQVKLEETETKGDEAEDKWREDSQSLDTLCLALGLLTNLVQIATSTKRIVRETFLNPACALKKSACARKCICSQPLSAIKILAKVYIQQQTKIESSTASLSADSVEVNAEADASFLRGHLAVLFGLLMIDCPENQLEILSVLSSPLATASPSARMARAANRTTLSRLVDQAKDFAAFYTAVSGQIGGEKESKITNEVVHFLEIERDAI